MAYEAQVNKIYFSSDEDNKVKNFTQKIIGRIRLLKKLELLFLDVDPWEERNRKLKWEYKMAFGILWNL